MIRKLFCFFLFSAFSFLSAESYLIPPQHNMTRLHSLKKLICSAVYLKHLSCSYSENDISSAVDCVYLHSIDENQICSHAAAGNIVSDLKKGNFSSFNEFYYTFYHSSTNEKCGFSILAHIIREKLSDSPELDPVFLKKIKEICTESDSLQLNMSENCCSSDHFCQAIASYHSKAADQLMITGDKEEYIRRLGFIEESYNLFYRIKAFEARGKIDDHTADLLWEAGNFEHHMEYKKAIDIYKTIIASSPDFAAEQGLHIRIGNCHKKLGDFVLAVDFYHQSISKDKPVPFQLSAYSLGKDIFLYCIPESQSTVLQLLSFINFAISASIDPVMKEKACYDRGTTLSLYSMKYTKTPEEKLEYQTAARNAFLDFARSFENSEDTTYAYVLAVEIMPSSPVKDILLDKIRSLIIESVDICQECINGFPQSYHHDYLLRKKSSLLHALGEKLYDQHYEETGEKKLDRKYLERAVECNELWLETFLSTHSWYSPGVYFECGCQYFALGQYYLFKKDILQSAENFLNGVEKFRKLLKLDSAGNDVKISASEKIAESYRNLGKAYLTISDSKEMWRSYLNKAIEEYRQLLDMEGSDQKKILVQIGDIQVETGLFSEALITYRTVLDDSEEISVWNCHAQLGKGDALYGLKQYSEAVSAYSRLFQMTEDKLLYCRADYSLGKTETAGKNYLQAHKYLAESISYNEISWRFDSLIKLARDFTANQLLHVKITPVIEKLKPSEQVKFTACLVYPDETSAEEKLLMNDDNWQWGCEGAFPQEYVMTPVGRHAFYTHISGEFSDRILTARYWLDTKMFIDEPQQRKVETHTWISGSNQLPVCLVNEERKRIKFLATCNPLAGKQHGTSTCSAGPFGLTIQFRSLFSSDNTSEITVHYYSAESTEAKQFVIKESSPGSGFFKSPDIEITILNPTPKTIFRESRYTPGSKHMKIRVRPSDAKLEEFQIPIWLWQGKKLSKQYFFASNRIFPLESSSDIDTSSDFPDNAPFYLSIRDKNISSDSITATLKSTIDQKQILCNRVSEGWYLSEKLWFAVNSEYSENSVIYSEKECGVIKVLPELTDKFKPGFTVSYTGQIISKSEKDVSSQPVPQAYCAATTGPAPHIETIGQSFTNLGYFPLKDESPVKDKFLNDIKSCSIIYLHTHGFTIDGKYSGFTIGHTHPSEYCDFLTVRPSHLPQFKRTTLVFINACNTGIRDAGSTILPQQKEYVTGYISKFKPDIYLSWKFVVNAYTARNFAKILFDKFETKNTSVQEAIDTAFTAIYSNNKDNVSIKGLKTNLYTGGSKTASDVFLKLSGK